jgi:hypothetical protein
VLTAVAFAVLLSGGCASTPKPVWTTTTQADTAQVAADLRECEANDYGMAGGVFLVLFGGLAAAASEPGTRNA